MIFGSLFSGIGGLDLGLERAGMECAWQVEIDPWCQRVLARHWPAVPRFGDIREVERLSPVDLICGGFPCQPVSLAGSRRGADDERWLWPEFARTIRLLRPRFVLVENVPGLASSGMGEVLGDLASLGFDAEWESLPAAAFGAPHLRYRIFIVAHARRDELQDPGRGGSPESEGSDLSALPRSHGAARPLADPNDERSGRGSLSAGGSVSRSLREDVGDPERQRLSERSASPRGAIFDAERAGLGRRGAAHWATEPDVGRVANGVPSRVDRLRGLGNAVVPQVAEWIGWRILEWDRGSAP